MGITYQSVAGQIFICDFKGYIENEIIKSRPVIAISAPSVSLRTNKLCHVIPLSTTEPLKVQPWHYKITNMPYINNKFCSKECWAKCDMIYTVSYNRLTAPYKGKLSNGKRNYVAIKVSSEDFLNIRKCVLAGLQYKYNLIPPSIDI